MKLFGPCIKVLQTNQFWFEVVEDRQFVEVNMFLKGVGNLMPRMEGLGEDSGWKIETPIRKNNKQTNIIHILEDFIFD